MKLKNWELSLLIAIVVTLFYVTVVSNEQAALSDKLVRLHVIANSDTYEDQQLKLRVRDRVLDVLSQPLEGVSDPETAKAVITDSFPLIERAAQEEIAASGSGLSVTVSLGRENYPTREYDTFSLPAGEYTSLRVELGNAGGQNWWCVVFPPLCTELSGFGELEATELLDEGEISLISEEDGYVVRFKCMELLAALRDMVKR